MLSFLHRRFYLSIGPQNPTLMFLMDEAEHHCTGLLSGATKRSLESLIAKGADVNLPDPDGWSPLHTAVFKGRLATTELLVKNGADVNAIGLFEWTPIHFAALNGHMEIANFLIANNAAVDAADTDGLTPEHLATEHGHNELANVLLVGETIVARDSKEALPLEKERGGGSLLSALEDNKNEETSAALICKGADVNEADPDGYTAMHSAAIEGFSEILRLLIEKGGNIHAKAARNRCDTDSLWCIGR